MQPFAQNLNGNGLRRRAIDVLQVNMGRYPQFGVHSLPRRVGSELHRDFDYLVESGRSLGRHVMARCNLTVIFELAIDYLPEFFKRHQVELICSLPCYSVENVDKQRGRFEHPRVTAVQ